MWRSPKSKDIVTSICGANVDLYGDGQQLLVIGFQSGKIEVRRSLTGEVCYASDQLKASGGAIAKIFFYDYRMAGKPQVVVVTSKGLIHGYTLQRSTKQFDIADDAEARQAAEKMVELGRRKIELENEIAKLTEQRTSLIDASI